MQNKDDHDEGVTVSNEKLSPSSSYNNSEANDDDTDEYWYYEDIIDDTDKVKDN